MRRMTLLNGDKGYLVCGWHRLNFDDLLDFLDKQLLTDYELGFVASLRRQVDTYLKNRIAISIKQGNLLHKFVEKYRETPLSYYEENPEVKQQVEDFEKSVGTPAEMKSRRCDSLHEKYFAVIYTENFDYARFTTRLAAYNLTFNDFLELWDKHEGKCHVCKEGIRLHKNSFSGEAFSTIDHCHKTGKVRGILCAGCNRRVAEVDKHDLDLLKFYMRNGGGSKLLEDVKWMRLLLPYVGIELDESWNSIMPPGKRRKPKDFEKLWAVDRKLTV